MRLQTRDNLLINGAEDMLPVLSMIKLDTGKTCKATC